MAKISSFEAYAETLRQNADARMGVLSSDDNLEVIPTGSVVFDKLSGVGGIPVGRITQIASEPGLGKSTTALSIAASCQRHGGKVLYLDFEQAMTYKYAEKMGCNITDNSLIIAQPIDIEMGWELIVAFSERGVNLVILDSLANMLPKIEDDDIKKLSSAVGINARGLSLFFPRFKNQARLKHFAGLCINQVRSKIEFGWGAGIQRSPAYSKELPGGWAPKFNTDLLYYMSLKKTSKEKGTDVSGDTADIYTGTELQVITWKNKFGISFQRAPAYLQFGKGLDDFRSVVEMGRSLGIIDVSTRGGFWAINSQGDYPGINVGEPIIKGRGEESIADTLAGNPAIYDYVRTRILDIDFLSESLSEEESKEIKAIMSEDGDSGVPVAAAAPPPIPAGVSSAKLKN